MMAGRVIEKADTTFNSATFGIECAEIEPPDPRERDRGRTHGARFQRHVQITIDEPLRSERCASRSDGEHLRMGGRIVEFARPIAR
jgi:hypothetical protein